MPKTTDLLVLGDCALDQYMAIDNPDIYEDPKSQEQKICFFHGTKVLVSDFKANLAGNACHVSVGTARLGLKTALYTELGDDNTADKFIGLFSHEGIDTTLCIKNSNTNTNVHAIISFGGERTIFSYHKPRTYSLPFDTLAPRWVFYTSLATGFVPFQAQLVDYLNKHPEIGVAVNPGTLQLQYAPESILNVLKVTHILFVNKEEACKITKTEFSNTTDLQDLHIKLQVLGPKLTVITLGKAGSCAYDGKEYVFLPAIEPTEPIVNKTGAGDAYTAGFLAAIILKKDLRTAMAWGSKNSASILTKSGCLEGLLDSAKIIL